MTKIRIAFIGCGGMAGAHLNGYLELKRRGLDIFDIVAVADPVEGKTAKFAERISEVQPSPEVKLPAHRAGSFTDFDLCIIMLMFSSGESSVPVVSIVTLRGENIEDAVREAVSMTEGATHIVIDSHGDLYAGRSRQTAGYKNLSGKSSHLDWHHTRRLV